MTPNINVSKLRQPLKLTKDCCGNKIITSVLGITLVASMFVGGCQNVQTSDNSLVPTTDSFTSLPNITDSVTSIETEGPVQYTLTKEDWETFVQERWEKTEIKLEDIDFNTFETAMMIFNIGYLNINNPQIIVNYFARNQDVGESLTKAYNTVSKIREYNNSTNDLYLMSSLFISPKDAAIIDVLEPLIREINMPDITISRVNSIHQTLVHFVNGNGKMAVIIGVNLAEVSYDELTKGAMMLVNKLTREVCSLCENINPELQTNSLSITNGDNAIELIQNILSANGAITPKSDLEQPYESFDNLLSQILYNIDYLSNEVKIMGVTSEEVKALYAVSNVDYFINSKISKEVFKEVYCSSNSIDINQLFLDAESAIEKIENYNLTAETVYDYGHFFFNSKVDIISVKALCSTISDLHSKDSIKINEAIEQLKEYNQYSLNTSVIYQEWAKDGKSLKTKELTKHSLDRGGHQIVDWLTYFALINNKQVINNDTLVNSIMSSIDGTLYEVTPFDNISATIKCFCLENNITLVSSVTNQYSLDQYNKNN